MTEENSSIYIHNFEKEKNKSWFSWIKEQLSDLFYAIKIDIASTIGSFGSRRFPWRDTFWILRTMRAVKNKLKEELGDFELYRPSLTELDYLYRLYETSPELCEKGIIEYMADSYSIQDLLRKTLYNIIRNFEIELYSAWKEKINNIGNIDIDGLSQSIVQQILSDHNIVKNLMRAASNKEFLSTIVNRCLGEIISVTTNVYRKIIGDRTLVLPGDLIVRLTKDLTERLKLELVAMPKYLSTFIKEPYKKFFERLYQTKIEIPQIPQVKEGKEIKAEAPVKTRRGFLSKLYKLLFDPTPWYQTTPPIYVFR
jgi:hypothetical protein